MKKIALLLIAGLLSLPLTVQAAVKGDGEALALISAIDRNEINAADYVLNTNNLAADSTDYANMMKRDHSDNLARAADLAAKSGLQEPKSPGVLLLEAKGAKDLILLKAAGEGKLDIAYIDASAQGHRDALKTIDNDIAPGVQNSEVKAFVAETRRSIDAHLKKAEELQQKNAVPSGY